jgi:hypothetical protein
MLYPIGTAGKELKMLAFPRGEIKIFSGSGGMYREGGSLAVLSPKTQKHTARFGKI